MTEHKRMAIEELKKHSALQSSILILPEQIARIDAQLTAPAAGRRADSTPVRGSGVSRAEEWLVGSINRKMALEGRLAAARAAVESVETALEALTGSERLLLQRFYISRERDYKDRLCQELGCEEAALYRRKERALGKFALALYGPEPEGVKWPS